MRNFRATVTCQTSSDLPQNRRETAIPPRRSRGDLVALGWGALPSHFFVVATSLHALPIWGSSLQEHPSIPATVFRLLILADTRKRWHLDDGETILFFYSDGITDIRNGFYFVSDKKVVIYLEAALIRHLTKILFEDIREVEIYRQRVIFEDSEITLSLEDVPAAFVPGFK